jgi:hypothetical protein
VEIWNITRTPLDMAKWRFVDGVSFEFPDFTEGDAQAHILKPLERIVVTSLGPAAARAAYGIPPGIRVFGPWTGALANEGERVTLSDKNGVALCSVSYKEGGRWPKAADGAGHSLVLKNENRAIDDYQVWGASNYRGGTPGMPDISGQDPFPGNPELATAAAVTVVDYGDVWRFNVPAGDPGTAWQSTSFDDSQWSSGAGLLGFEDAALPPPGCALACKTTGPSRIYFARLSPSMVTRQGRVSGSTRSSMTERHTI